MAEKTGRENTGESISPNDKVTEKETAVQPVANVKHTDTVEFKIGAGIFSMVGAVFVLASFVIFWFNFL